MSIGTVSASRGQALVPGRPGHPTPTGVFTILEKEVHHTSSIYKGAEMPYMERVTWGGIALHAGDLPGYPDSHGCVRLPLEFSKLLFGVTMKGATVVIADQRSAPGTTVHPGLFFAQSGQESEPIAAGQFDWDPDISHRSSLCDYQQRRQNSLRLPERRGNRPGGNTKSAGRCAFEGPCV